MPKIPPDTEAYFETLEAATESAYEVARQARSRGLDPATEPEIPRAKDLAERVENLVGPEGVAETIRELSETMDREAVSLEVAKSVARGEFASFETKGEALDAAVRTGLAILTEGVLVAPLEGIADARIETNEDGSECATLVFAGPIRSAGGTGEALSVLIADVVRRELDLAKFEATRAEVERYKEEIPAYKRAVNLQYTPDADEIEAIVSSCPVGIDGEGTSDEEVSGYRDLRRVETNNLRGGACLVIAEGIAQKIAKLKGHVDRLGIDGWSFLDEMYSADADEDEETTSAKATSLGDTYLKDLVAGRPVLGHPSRPGGFRLRYGRARTGGLASTAIHPATMVLVDEFLAVGTQMKIAGPGKATIATPCDELTGPTVLLEGGDLVRVDTVDEAHRVADRVAQILDLGDLLVPFGEFLENNKPLLPGAWVEEWWTLEVEAAGHEPDPPGSAEQAFAFAEETGTPLHPRWTLAWHDLDRDGLATLRDALAGRATVEDGELVAPAEPVKDQLIELCLPHREEDGEVRVAEPARLLVPLGLTADDGAVRPDGDLPDGDPMAAVREMAGVEIRRLAPTRIGARVGRPEKAAPRKMKPPIHVIFPLGRAGGMQRLVKDAVKQGTISVEVGMRTCVECGDPTPLVTCSCGGHTEPQGGWASTEEIPVAEFFDRAKERVAMSRVPDVKGVRGTMSKDKTPEPLEKGILRAEHDVWVFKDGTLRFDMTDVTLTHFRPREVGLSVERARELGYTEDVDGEPLGSEDQVVELKVQDVVISRECAEYLLRCADFVDDLLVRYYHLDPFYEAETVDDLVGHQIVGLAPHTSGGVLGRVVGIADAKGGFAHPYFHAAKRRNCLDGGSEVLLADGGLRRRSLASLWEAADGGETVDDVGTEARDVEEAEVLAADPATGSVEPRRILRIIRAPAPDHLVEVRTASGRSLTCSPRHRVEVVGEDGLEKRRAVELEEGDCLAFAGKVPMPDRELDDLDLLREFAEDPPDGLMVRGLGDWLEQLVDDLGGAKRAAKAGDVGMKALDNYRRRDSIPWEVLEAMLAAAGLSLGDVPDEVRLAVARDTVEIPRIIAWTPSLLRLLGYYLAEGYARAREGRHYQVGFGVGEEALAEEIASAARESLGLDPSRSEHILTLSGRLVHRLFVDVLRLGKDAHDKQIPARIASLPEELTSEMLAAYFAGDGSVETGRLHVTCHSVNRGLLRDVGLQLASRGIAYRLRREERKGGGVVQAFYEDKEEPVPTYVSHRLSIRSTHAVRFLETIGFTLDRKQEALEAVQGKVRSDRFPDAPGDLVGDPVKEVEPLDDGPAWVYDLEVEEHHNFLVDDLTLTSNCDGDEDCVMLLLDGLLNFSRTYLPATRGGLMDAPLVLTTRIDPEEIDTEAHNVDVASSYPLEIYDAARQGRHPDELAEAADVVETRIGTPGQYEGFGFTHDTADICEAPAASAYKTLGTMIEKMEAQLGVGDRIRAVDVADVAGKVITTHFLPDLIGNLKAFSRQTVRCAKCNTKYRRVPLTGECRNCGNDLTMTVHEASVTKYLDIAKEVAETYGVGNYTRQRIELVEQSIESLFSNDKVEETSLEDFF